MNYLKLADNIMNLRRRRGITQDELADFLGVTKASVSKWETKQSLPDIMLLPKIASYFDISIDELLGYQSQLSQEEIRKHYHKFAADYAERPFEEVMGESKEFVKQYYSCYPALLQIVVLWMNHYMLAEKEERQKEILGEIVELCEHIESHCANMGICSDVAVLKAVAKLPLGKAEEAIQILEPLHDPKRLSDQSENVLIQAYQMIGATKKAEEFNQFSIYKHLLALVGSSITFLAFHMQEKDVCLQTINRVTDIIDSYEMRSLHPNITLQFYYQSAMFYSLHGEKDNTLKALDTFVKGSLSFLKEGCKLHGDSYFNHIDQYFEELDLGAQPPRNEQMILSSVRQAIENPVFSFLFESKEYEKIKNLINLRRNA